LGWGRALQRIPKKRREKLDLENYKETISFISSLTGIKEEIILFNFQMKGGYKRIKKPKDPEKTKFRILHVPNKDKMFFLQALLEKVLYRLPVSDQAHCAVIGRSVVSNVRYHEKSISFFRVDLKDAFPSIGTEMVEKRLTPLIEENIFLHKAEKLASFLAEVLTFNNLMPQGSPTSPYLMNLVCFQLDRQLKSLADEYKLVFTRYADDFWFSSIEEKIPTSARRRIIENITDYGFKINRQKIKYKTGRATVPKITGITITRDRLTAKPKLNYPRKKIEEYRGRIKKACRNFQVPESDIFGMISWSTMVTGEIPKRLRAPFREFLKIRCKPEVLKKYNYLL
jgi:RNA-directed DNA polymerase